MELSPQELDDLAVFFDKRQAPPPEFDDWRAALDDAQDCGTLPSLVRQQAAADPSDANLQKMAELFGNRRLPAWFGLAATAGVAGGGAVLSLAAVALVAVQLTAAPTAEPEEVAALQPQSQAVQADVVEPVVEEVAAPPPPTKPAVAKNDYEVATVVSPRFASRAASPGSRCSEGSGVIGYWFFGNEEAPGQVGDLLHLNTTRNVRAELPDFDNDFDTKTPVTCELLYGDVIELTAAPIRVAGGYWWVPFAAGDLRGAKPIPTPPPAG